MSVCRFGYLSVGQSVSVKPRLKGGARRCRSNDVAASSAVEEGLGLQKAEM